MTYIIGYIPVIYVYPKVDSRSRTAHTCMVLINEITHYAHFVHNLNTQISIILVINGIHPNDMEKKLLPAIDR